MALNLKSRLNKIAARWHVCPIHGVPLYCATCYFEWTGSDEEVWEL